MSEPTELIVEHLWAIFDGFVAVRDLSLTVGAGELRCLIGPNGAGKSTLLDLICGKVTAAKGTIRFRGRNITTSAEYQRSRLGIGRKFQVPMVFPELTVEENLAVAARLRPTVWAGLRGWWHAGVRASIDEVLANVGLEERAQTKANTLSHGEVQWLEMAMLLIQDCSLLLMDEPTAGMTSAETTKTGEIFSRLKGKHTLVVVEHDMQFVRQIAEQVTVLHQGQLLAQGDIGQIQTHPEVQRVYLGSLEHEHVSAA